MGTQNAIIVPQIQKLAKSIFAVFAEDCAQKRIHYTLCYNNYVYLPGNRRRFVIFGQTPICPGLGIVIFNRIVFVHNSSDPEKERRPERGRKIARNLIRKAHREEKPFLQGLVYENEKKRLTI